MSAQTRRQAAALLEVLGVCLAGAFLNDKLVELLREAGKRVFAKTRPMACIFWR